MEEHSIILILAIALMAALLLYCLITLIKTLCYKYEEYEETEWSYYWIFIIIYFIEYSRITT